MDWFGDHINDMLALIRAIHFAATSIVVGSLIFRLLMMGPFARSPQAVAVWKQTVRIAAIGLVVVMASGAIWLLLQAAAMSGLPFNEAVTADVLSTVVTGTQFGLAQDVRFALAIILAGCLSYDHLAPSRWLGLLSALGLIAAIAWTGHAGAGIGEMGALHLAADVLHLIGAAAATFARPGAFPAGRHLPLMQAVHARLTKNKFLKNQQLTNTPERRDAHGR
jgi:putative copper resistance protein D